MLKYVYYKFHVEFNKDILCYCLLHSPILRQKFIYLEGKKNFFVNELNEPIVTFCCEDTNLNVTSVRCFNFTKLHKKWIEIYPMEIYFVIF